MLLVLRCSAFLGNQREREEPINSGPSKLMLIQGRLLNAQFTGTWRKGTDPQDLYEFVKWELCVLRLTGNGLGVQVRYGIHVLFVFCFSSHGDISLRVNKDKEREGNVEEEREINRHSGLLLTSHIHLEYEYEKRQSCVLCTDGISSFCNIAYFFCARHKKLHIY